MADRDPGVERRQRRAEHRGGVPLDQHEVGAVRAQPSADRGEDPAGQFGQGLPRLHQVEVMIGPEAEVGERLVEHLPVLGGREEHGAEPGGRAQRLVDRSHLDGFGAGADDEGDGAHQGWREWIRHRRPRRRPAAPLGSPAP
jgi:hypothetical protein